MPDITATIDWGLTGAAELNQQRFPQVSAAIGWGVAGAARVAVGFSGALPPQVATIDHRLLGAVGYCHGPQQTAILGRGHLITALSLRDPVRIPVLQAWDVGGRVVAVASRVLEAAEPLVFVLVAPSATASQLQVWGEGGDGLVRLSTIEIPGAATDLIGPDSAAQSQTRHDFVVVTTAEGRVFIFGATALPELLAEAQTGTYQPRVAAVVPAAELWHPAPLQPAPAVLPLRATTGSTIVIPADGYRLFVNGSEVDSEVVDLQDGDNTIQLTTQGGIPVSGGTVVRVVWSITSPLVVEDAGVAEFVITRTDGGQSVPVTWATANGTAVAGTDYTAVSGAGTMGAELTVAVPIVDRAGLQGNRTFTLSVSLEGVA